MKKHVASESQSDEVELIIGNSNSNFSGVTSTMLQVMSYQKNMLNLRIMGSHFLPDQTLAISFWETAKMCRRPLKNGKWRIFHARRVDEMIQGLLLKYLFRAKIKLVFSSAAQRTRSASTVWLTRKMDAVIAVSKRSAGFLCDPPDLINPHGVQVNDYLPAKDKQQAWAELGYGGKYGIGILGRVRKQKGVHLLVNACIELFDKYPEYHCVVVGAISSSNKEFVEQLKSKAAQANMTDRITFTGELPFEQIPRIFSALSLVSALSDNEGFGLTVLEAMSSGAAVLATEAGAWEEIVRPAIDGYIVPVNNQQAVTEKMDLMLSNPEKLAQMGIEGRKRVESHYRVEDEATRLIEFFRSLQ
ncbi:glycosyltransferase family 4 protein [uncultured Paraglaciecola sp.]|uniref:glycosyltransferase family 4 protein n=1 Tax=uncultured Paraglaciecola sp. TaxID=1765024 RepID=UPI0030D70280|tara:strand:+ start:30395 stop:31471 length:1077 start_codon:yes stop_codon:yes gene_type:complete